MERIAGIDPGTQRLGYCFLESDGRRQSLLAIGTIELSGRRIEERLRQLFDRLDALFRRYKPRRVAVERVYVGSNPMSALSLGMGRGIVLLCAARARARVSEIAASEAKKAVAGNGQADKEQVQRMIRLLLRIEEPLALDAGDAAALALCDAWRQPEP